MIPHFVIPWIFFGFLLLIATLFEKRNPVAPAPMRAVIIDWKIALLRNVGNQLSSPVTAGIMFVSAMMGGGLIHLRSDGWWFPVSIVVIMLSIDFVSYWIHRTQHAWPMLWAMHSLHHSAVSLTVMTGARHFWLEDIYIRLVYAIPMGILFKVPAEVAATTTMLFLLLGDALAHLNMRVSLGPFALCLNNPQYHRIHHSVEPQHQNKNFCKLLPLFDLMFGTVWKPGKDEFPATGLATGDAARGFFDGIIWPVRHRMRGFPNVSRGHSRDVESSSGP